MFEDIVRKIHVDLVYSERRLGTNGIPPHDEVAFYIPDVIIVSVLRLLNNRIHIQLEIINETLLR